MKKISSLLACILSVFFAHAQIPTNGLIGGWPFTGNANDMSGNSNHGTASNCTLTTDRFGASNSAYSFNGFSSYIVMGSAGPTGTVSRSVSFWGKTSSSSGPVVGFNYGDINVSGGIYQIVFNYGCQGVGFDNGSATFEKGSSSINNGQWHHYVAVLNATSTPQIGNVDFYIDGVLQGTMNCGGGNSPLNSSSATPITIGKSCNSSLRYWNGQLDDFYMYNRALSYSEVLALYNYTPCTVAPSAPSSILGNTVTCLSSGIASFSAQTVSGAGSYTWNLPSGWPTGSTQVITPPSAPYSGTISVAAVNSCGQSAFTTVSVNINQVVVFTSAANFSTICPGGSAVLSVSGPGSNSYLWSTGSSSSVITVSPSTSTTYSVTGSNSFGCTLQQAITVNVIGGATPAISVTSNGVGCAGKPVTLASNGASSYTWQPGNMTGFLVTAYPAVSTVYTVTGSSSNGCVGTATFAQAVMPAPVVQISAGTGSACSGQTLALIASGAVSYTWMPGFLNGSSISATAAPGLTYSVSGTSSSGCESLPATSSIPVFTTPTLTVGSAQPEICRGQSVTIGATGAQSFTWYPGNLTGSSITVSPPSNTTYTVLGMNANGCTSSVKYLQTVQNCNSLAEVDLSRPLIYPNPVASELNLEINGVLKSISIQNTLGTVLFSSNELSDKKIELSWLPEGTYVVRLQTDKGIYLQKIVKLAD